MWMERRAFPGTGWHMPGDGLWGLGSGVCGIEWLLLIVQQLLALDDRPGEGDGCQGGEFGVGTTGRPGHRWVVMVWRVRGGTGRFGNLGNLWEQLGGVGRVQFGTAMVV